MAGRSEIGQEEEGSERRQPEADQAKIAAEYKDGVLQISLPKRTEQKPKKIDIKID